MTLLTQLITILAIHHSNEYFRSFSVNLMRRIEACLQDVNEKFENSLAKKESIAKRRKAIVGNDYMKSDTINQMIRNKSPNQFGSLTSQPHSSQEYQPLSPQQYESQLHNSQRVMVNPLPNRVVYNPFSCSQSNDIAFNDFQSAPGLLGTDLIKQMFGIDHSTPVLEVLRIAEKMLGVNVNGSGTLPMRVQVIKSAMGLP